MTSSILTTKLFIPPLRQDLLPRTHLIQKLEESTGYPLTLISASAGSGKTTALSEWVARNNHLVAWLSLDQDDNDPVQFLTYIIFSLRKIEADFGEDLLEILDSGQTESEESCLTKIINGLVEFPAESFLVFDDYHTIHNPKVHELVAFFIDHLPPQMHLIFASRVDPPWALARYRARNQLYEIRGQDLRFSTEEILEFLDRTAGLSLSLEDVSALEERTEGWVAGLQLAALSMQGHSDIPKFVKDFTGSHVFVAEYLIEEILHQQPENIESFLLRTSILDRLHAGLCEAVAACDDGKEIIDILHRANIFIIPLDHEGQWFRYHHLFADLLQSRLRQAYTQEQIAEFHARASDWFEGRDYIVEAVHHAFAARHYEKAAHLVDTHGQKMFFAERYIILRNWLDALPTDYFETHPRLEIYKLLIDLLDGTLDMFEQTLAEKEKRIKALPSSPDNDRLRRRALVNLAMFYAFQNTAKAIQVAEDTLAEIPEDDLHMRAYLFSTFYRAYGMEGDVDKASTAYRESFRLAEVTGQYEMISNTTKIRTYDLCQYGKLDEAAEYCQRIIDFGKQQKLKVFYPAGPCYVGLAGIHLERNQIGEAEEALTLGLKLCHEGAKYGLFTGYVQKIRLLQAKGQIEEALKELQLFEQTFQRREFTFLTQKVSLILAAEDLEAAREMVPYFNEILGASYYAQNLPLVAGEFFRFCLARIYLKLGDLDKVFRLLDENEPTVEAGKRMGRLMEIHMLRALALQRQNPEDVPVQAVAEMVKAIELAIDPGYCMLFVEEGPALLPLLQAVVNQPTTAKGVRQYAQKLIEAFPTDVPQPFEEAVPTAHQLVEQLTARELEVLQLIAIGDSNQVIADKLVITVRTVKKHTSNIYAKLNVSSRTQAVAYAREIGLLPID